MNEIETLKAKLPRTEFTVKVGGRELQCTIPPCCFMYRGYKMQLSVAYKGEKITLQKEKAHTDATVHEYIELAKSCEFITCKCGCETFAGKKQWDGSGKPKDCNVCEKCRIEALNKWYQEAKAKEEQKIKKEEIALKAKGFTLVLRVIVHLHRGGDDKVMDLYAKDQNDLVAQVKQLSRTGRVDVGKCRAL